MYSFHPALVDLLLTFSVCRENLPNFRFLRRKYHVSRIKIVQFSSLGTSDWGWLSAGLKTLETDGFTIADVLLELGTFLNHAFCGREHQPSGSDVSKIRIVINRNRLLSYSFLFGFHNAWIDFKDHVRRFSIHFMASNSAESILFFETSSPALSSRRL